ncbi:hypothetical protein ACHAWF_006170, partial [Thalassiosira exigua]
GVATAEDGAGAGVGAGIGAGTGAGAGAGGGADGVDTPESPVWANDQDSPPGVQWTTGETAGDGSGQGQEDGAATAGAADPLTEIPSWEGLDDAGQEGEPTGAVAGQEASQEAQGESGAKDGEGVPSTVSGEAQGEGQGGKIVLPSQPNPGDAGAGTTVAGAEAANSSERPPQDDDNNGGIVKIVAPIVACIALLALIVGLFVHKRRKGRDAEAREAILPADAERAKPDLLPPEGWSQNRYDQITGGHGVNGNVGSNGGANAGGTAAVVATGVAVVGGGVAAKDEGNDETVNLSTSMESEGATKATAASTAATAAMAATAKDKGDGNNNGDLKRILDDLSSVDDEEDGSFNSSYVSDSSGGGNLSAISGLMGILGNTSGNTTGNDTSGDVGLNAIGDASDSKNVNSDVATGSAMMPLTPLNQMGMEKEGTSPNTTRSSTHILPTDPNASHNSSLNYSQSSKEDAREETQDYAAQDKENDRGKQGKPSAREPESFENSYRARSAMASLNLKKDLLHVADDVRDAGDQEKLLPKGSEDGGGAEGTSYGVARTISPKKSASLREKQKLAIERGERRSFAERIASLGRGGAPRRTTGPKDMGQNGGGQAAPQEEVLETGKDLILPVGFKRSDSVDLSGNKGVMRTLSEELEDEDEEGGSDIV